MKRFMGMLMVSALVLGVAVARASAGCCSGEGAAKTGANFTAKNDCFAKLNLSDDQKSKVTALMADCKAGGCNAAARDKMTAGLKGILTPDQYAQWTAACEQAKTTTGGKCPFTAKTKGGNVESKD